MDGDCYFGTSPSRWELNPDVFQVANDHCLSATVFPAGLCDLFHVPWLLRVRCQRARELFVGPGLQSRMVSTTNQSFFETGSD